MNKIEIELLAKWQKEIETVEQHLSRFHSERDWNGREGRDSSKLTVWGGNLVDSVNISEIPELRTAVLDLIIEAYERHLAFIKERRDTLVLCHEQRASNFTPIEIA